MALPPFHYLTGNNLPLQASQYSSALQFMCRVEAPKLGHCDIVAAPLILFQQVRSECIAAVMADEIMVESI